MAEKEYIERGAFGKNEVFGKEDILLVEGEIFVRASKVYDAVLDTPAADAAEVRHAEWKVVYQNENATVYECSECGHLCFGTSDFCICGAKMDGKGESV